MLTRYLRGSTAELNALNLPDGHLAYDEERKAIRFYDGETQGGFEVIGEPAFNLGPGPKQLLAGDYQWGYFGELSSGELVSGDVLAIEVGLSEGVGINSEVGWFKFAYKGKILYVAKQGLRHSVSWDQLYRLGLVYGTEDNGLHPTGSPMFQLAPLTVGSDAFLVRLPTGGEGDPATGAGGEWDDLLVGLTDGSFDTLSESDLGIASGSWCQEVPSGSPTSRVTRGGSTVGTYGSSLSAGVSPDVVWRPVIELTSVNELLFPMQDFYFESDYVQIPNTYYFHWSDASQGE